MIKNKKQIQRAKETISKLDEYTKRNEDLIVKYNQFKKKAEDNYDVQNVIKFEKIMNKLKQHNRIFKQYKKVLTFEIADFTTIDKSTVNAVSNIPVTREYLQDNYRVSNTFKDVTLNSINAELPVRLSSNALNKIIVESFPSVKVRKVTGDVRYNLEMI